MTTTNFTAGTVIASTWLNDVDDAVYRKVAEWVSVVDQGADDTGVADSSAAFTSALATGKPVYIPKGSFRLNSTITIPNNSFIFGAGLRQTNVNFYGTGSAFVSVSEARNITVEHFTLHNLASGSSTIGLSFLQARNCTITKMEIMDWAANGSAAIKFDGSTTFCASNRIDDVLLGRNYMGIYLTADSGFQCNHTQIIGGYIYGSVAVKAIANSCGIFIERGDTNYIIGTGVEDFDIGYRITSTDAAGQTLVCPRVEACNTNYSISAAASNIVIVAPIGDLDESTFGGAGDSAISISKVPYLRLDKAYLTNNSYLRAKTSGGSRQNILGITASDHTLLRAPSGAATNELRLVDANGTVLGTLVNGAVVFNVPTSAAGLPSGAIWRDAAASHVIKMVP